MTIWKFPLVITEDDQHIHVAVRHSCLCVQEQHGKLTLWCLVGEDTPPKTITVRVFGTGWQMPDDIVPEQYIGTCQIGLFVWHVFKMA